MKLFGNPRTGAHMLRLAVTLGVLLGLGSVPSPAPAQMQSLGEAIQNSLNRSAALIQQQSNTAQSHPDIVRGGLQRGSHETRRQRVAIARPVSSAGLIAADAGSLDQMDATTYRLSNGVQLQVTGLFNPDVPTVCIAYCPLSDRQRRFNK